VIYIDRYVTYVLRKQLDEIEGHKREEVRGGRKVHVFLMKTFSICMPHQILIG
jgi:hypothetical protein